MKFLVRLALVFIALTVSAMAADQSTEEPKSVCDESVYYGNKLYISIAEVHERVVSLSWPDPPPGARIEGNAVFQIKVALSGKVCSIESVGGHRLLLAVLTPEIKKWKFRPEMPFVGLVAVRYAGDPRFPESKGYQFL